MTGCPDYRLEEEACAGGLLRVAGVDEAGRGPLAGPVVAAAVRLERGRIPDGLDDSKRLPPERRETLFALLMREAEVGVGIASVEEIDGTDILRASHLAMLRALAALALPAEFVLVDGPFLPAGLACRGRAVVGGDALCLSIAAASIVAKVTRDRIMVDLAQHHPGYGWERNMGYPTPEHRRALQALGITPHHRRTFAPVHNILYQAETVSS